MVMAPQGSVSSALEGAAAAYRQVNGTRVQVDVFGSENYSAQSNAALLAGLLRYDLVYLPAEDLARWANYHAIQPLSSPLDDPAQQPWLRAVRVAGQLYGLPTQPDPLVLWYRADLLKSAGLPIPASWEDLRKAAHSMDLPQKMDGIAIAGSDLDACVTFSAVAASFGGVMVSDQYRVEMDGAALQKALAFYTALATASAHAGPGADRFTNADVLSSLRSGRAALGIAPLSAKSTLFDCSGAAQACKEGRSQLSWTRLPGITEQLAVGSLGVWAIPLHAAHSGQAQHFLSWLGSEAGARAWAAAGGAPAYTGVLAGEEKAALGGITDFRLAFPQVSTVDLLWKACNNAVHSAIVEALAQTGTSANTAEQRSAKVLDTAADQMRQALRQAGIELEK